MTLNEFKQEYEGKSVGYPEGKYVGECLSLVKWYIKKIFNISPPPSGSNSAHGYWYNFPSPLPTVFEKVENTLEAIPKTGDIIIWNEKTGNGYGHIAIVLKADIHGFTSLDQNWGSKNAIEVNHTYTNVLGWLTPKGNSMPINTDLDRLLKHIGADSVDVAIKKWDEQIGMLESERKKMGNIEKNRDEFYTVLETKLQITSLKESSPEKREADVLAVLDTKCLKTLDHKSEDNTVTIPAGDYADVSTGDMQETDEMAIDTELVLTLWAKFVKFIKKLGGR